MYCHGLTSPSVSDRQQSRLCTVMDWHHPQSQQTAVQTVYCHGLASPSVSGRQQSRLCTVMDWHHPQSQQTAVQTVYCHGLASPSVSADSSPDCVLSWTGITLSLSRQQSRLCTAMDWHHPQSQQTAVQTVYCHGLASPSVSADTSPDCVLPWPSITLSLRQTAVQTVYCHGLASPSVSADSSPDCVLPWTGITLSLRQTAVQTVYCHGLTSPSAPAICSLMISPHDILDRSCTCFSRLMLDGITRCILGFVYRPARYRLCSSATWPETNQHACRSLPWVTRDMFFMTCAEVCRDFCGLKCNFIVWLHMLFRPNRVKRKVCGPTAIMNHY